MVATRLRIERDIVGSRRARRASRRSMLRDREKNSTIWSAALDELDDQKRLFTDARLSRSMWPEGPWQLAASIYIFLFFPHSIPVQRQSSLTVRARGCFHLQAFPALLQSPFIRVAQARHLTKRWWCDCRSPLPHQHSLDRIVLALSAK